MSYFDRDVLTILWFTALGIQSSAAGSDPDVARELAIINFRRVLDHGASAGRVRTADHVVDCEIVDNVEPAPAADSAPAASSDLFGEAVDFDVLRPPARDRSKRRWNELEEDGLIELVRCGWSWEKIGDWLGRSAEACRQRYFRELQGGSDA